MLGNQPPCWPRAQLGDLIASLEAGVSVNSEGRERRADEIGILKTSCVGGGRFDPSEHKSVVSEERGRVRMPVKGNSIILSRMNTPNLVGENGFVKDDYPDLFLPDRLWLLRTNERADCRWLSYFMQSDDFRSQIDDIATGTSGSMKNISKGRLIGVSLSLPPLNEQQRIVEVLHAVDEAIDSNLMTLKQVEHTRKAILFAAFEAAAWEPVALGELGKWRSGGTPPKDDEANWHGAIPWICPRDMKVPTISRSNTTITELALRGSLRTVSPGTLLLVVRGMILAGAIPTAITAVEASFNQDIKAFIPNGRASPRFVQLCIQHQEEQLLRSVNTATHGTKKLDSDTIESIAVPLPNKAEQDALVEMVSRLDEATVHYGAEHIRLNQVKSGLLAELLSGRVRVPA